MPGCTTRRRAPRSSTACLARRKTACTVAPFRPRNERPAGHAAQDVVVAQRDSAELAADEGGADVADDGFDFGELGHRVRNLTGGAARTVGNRRRQPSPRPVAASRQPMSRRKTLPSNSIASAVSRLSRCASAKRRRHGRHVEHASAVDPQHAVRPPRGARMEDRDAGRQLLGNADGGALLGPVRISPRGQHRRHRRLAGPAGDRGHALAMRHPPERVGEAARPRAAARPASRDRPAGS